MKRTCFVVFALLFTGACLFTNRGLAQDYKHHATLTGHTGAIFSVAFSPDGRTLASGSLDMTVRLWNTSTGRLLNTLTGHTGWIDSLVFSPDGRTLASGSLDNTIRLWHIPTGRLRGVLTGHTDTVSSVVFSPDGKTLASGSWDKTIRLWNVQTGRLRGVLTGHTETVESVVFSPDGRTLASGSLDNTIRLWHIPTGRLKNTLIGHTDEVKSVAFSTNGQILASGSADNTIRLWSVRTGRLRKVLTGHSYWIDSVAFSPNGQILTSGDLDNTIRLWDVPPVNHINTLAVHTDVVLCVAFSRNRQTLASGEINNTIRLWKTPTQPSLKASTSGSARVYSTSPQKSSAERTYDNTIRSVMWIVTPGVGQGSGVLIDKRLRLAVTNAHVTGTQRNVDVYFPAADENEKLINDRDFYKGNRGVLKRLGYYTRGEVVARNTETDLAIIKLEGLSETAREIEWNFNRPGAEEGDLVYILGNPGGQELWRWTLGEYLQERGGFLHIQSPVFPGNSGGPVLSKQGILLGIITRSDSHINAFAIPVRKVSQLLSESGLKHSRTR